jgi:enoyl-CoA hydratase
MMNAMGTGAALRLVREQNDAWDKAFPAPQSLATLATTNGSWELPTVDVSVDGPAAVLTIQRPAAMNALNSRVLEDLGHALTIAERTAGVRAIVLTGEGSAFVSGADIREMSDKGPWDARTYAQLGQQLTRRFETSHLPVIAAINGYAFGGGLELAMAADILLVAEEAQLGLPEVSLGIQPGFGGTQRLPRLVGRQRAKALVMTGLRFGGQEAADIGLALKCVPRARLYEEAFRIVEQIAANAPLAVASAKASVNRGIETDLDTGLALELTASSILFGTHDQREGMRAFQEKRKPAFRGE